MHTPTEALDFLQQKLDAAYAESSSQIESCRRLFQSLGTVMPPAVADAARAVPVQTAKAVAPKATPAKKRIRPSRAKPKPPPAAAAAAAPAPSPPLAS